MRTLDDDAVARLTPEDLDAIWSHFRDRYAAARGGEAELYHGICQLVADAEAAGRLDPLVADAIRSELGNLKPSEVLGAYWSQLIEDRPAIGAYAPAEVTANAA